MPTNITLGIDCGTQGTKTVAIDGERVIASASHPYELIAGLPNGAAEQHPHTWVQAVEETVAEVLAALTVEQRSSVSAIGVSGQQHGFVPLDAAGEVIRPAKLWCDTSTQEECELLRAHFGGAPALIERVGLDMLPGYTAPKILWLKRHEPANFARLATVLLPHDYLNFFLTGALTMEYGDASGTALLDIRKREWQTEVVEAIDPALASKLPDLQSSLNPAGTLRPELAQKWGLSPDTLVSAGGGDNMMTAIGTGNIAEGRVTASLGTSGTIFAYSKRPVTDTLGEVAGFCDSTDAWMPLVCTMNVTVATEAARGLFGWDVKTFDTAVASVPAGADGITFLPYLQGERTPNLPHGTGAFLGLTTKNFTPAHFARAAMEGATLGLAYGLGRLRSLGITPREIRLAGGGSNSKVWRQLCADVFACPVTTGHFADGAAFGAALQARALTEPLEKCVAPFTTPAETVEPSDNYDYASALERQTNAMRKLY